MKTEVKNKVNLISTKALQKYYKNNRRNNTNSVDSNNYSFINISRNNNKFSI